MAAGSDFLCRVVVTIGCIVVLTGPATCEDAQKEPLHVTATTPSAGETGVPITTPITATFSEAVDLSSVSGTIFSLSETSGSITYDHESRTIVFTPAESLSRNTTYTATVSGSVKDNSGMEMGRDHGWSFTTAAGTTVIGNGRYTADGRTEPGNRTISANMTAFLDAFDLSTPEGPVDRIKSLTVKPSPPGISADIASVEIITPTGEVKGKLLDPRDEPWVVPVEGLSADRTQWLVRIRTRNALRQDVHRVTGKVTDAQSELGNRIDSKDETSATITIDGRPPVPQTLTGSITFPTVTGDTMTVQVTFDGDLPPAVANNGCILRWGTSPTKYPNVAATVRNGNLYTAVIRGLTRGTAYFFEATFTDPDGVKGPNPLKENRKTEVR